MNSKIQSYHLQKMAFIYLRQSTTFQVMHNQESTDRQYALQGKAIQYGWDATNIRILDGDLGKSGSHTTHRDDFKTLVAEVSMGNVGAIFVLEASRLSRSSADWSRLLELCALTQTLIIDQDGCYDPSQFNDQLLLGLKGTMSQAELHLIKARLHGAKLNKAKRGELRCSLPVGYIYDQEGNVTFDPDEQVCHVVKLLFEKFREKQTAYAVVQYFGYNNIAFPKRSFGGSWKGKLLWGKLTHERVLNILKNPTYAGVYTYGRHKSVKKINDQGEIITTLRGQPMEEWQVIIKDHHCQYISHEEYEHNVEQLQLNKANIPDYSLAGPPREGLTLLQGLLICGVCGRRMTIRYTCDKKLRPHYLCNFRKRQGVTHCSCFSFRADIADAIIEQKVMEVLTPANVSIAINALGEIDKRNASLDKHWEMNIQRCSYQVDIAQRRFEQVDPANRLVAASLEKNWNQELEKLALTQKEYQEYQVNRQSTFPDHKRREVIALAKDIPTLWSMTTDVRDKKRIMRLLINDITVTKDRETKTLFLNIRWQGGRLEQIQANLPLSNADRTKCPVEIVEKIRIFTEQYEDDRKTVALLNELGLRGATGKVFTREMVQWIRFYNNIELSITKSEYEYTLKQVHEMFNISKDIVYRWIKNKYVKVRKIPDGSYLIEITPTVEADLRERIRTSSHINSMKFNSTASLGDKKS